MDITEAEIKINAILAELETWTGSVVESLSLERIETTNMESVRAEFQVSVQIELARLPSQSWRTK
ncbi:hypothetical protein D3C85_622300 [compost metagenome]